MESIAVLRSRRTRSSKKILFLRGKSLFKWRRFPPTKIAFYDRAAIPTDSVLTVRDKWPDEIFCPALLQV